MTNELRTAAENLPGKWHKNDFTDYRGNYCGLGHIMRAHGMKRSDVVNEDYLDREDAETIKEQMNLAGEVAKELFPDRFEGASLSWLFGFPTFNDHPDTTEEEAVQVLEKAAIRWEERV